LRLAHVEAALLDAPGDAAAGVREALAACVARVHPATRVEGPADARPLRALREVLSACAGAGVLAASGVSRLDPRAALALLALVPAAGGPDLVAPQGAQGADTRLAFFHARLLPAVERELARGGGSLAQLAAGVDALLVPAADLTSLGWK
jgi:hypothetical protein